MNFQVQLESEADVGSNEVLYIAYNSFTDLTGSIEAGSFFSPVNISGAYSTTGLAYDGSQYIVQLESEADVGSNEVLYITYNSFTDLTGSIEAGSFFSPVNISGAYSTTGLAYDGNKGSSGGVIPEPSTMLLFGTGLAGLAGWRWRKPR
ncbi:MAG: PEP-CTERM sorting domain-containing protein [Nitrospirota bacterium]|nr:PEP-CTERM sorting domain-containing protein [Nitrospirota bacterium]